MRSGGENNGGGGVVEDDDGDIGVFWNKEANDLFLEDEGAA